MLELYDNSMSTCTQKVRLVLSEKNVEWTSHLLNLRQGDQYEDYYMKLNPNGVVPTLVYNGDAIIESSVICEFLDDAFPEPALRPNDPVLRAKMRLWIRRFDDSMHAMTGVLSMGIAFRHEYIAQGEDQVRRLLDAEPSAAKAERKEDLIFNGMESDRISEAVFAFDRLLEDMERHLQHTEYLAGDHFSLADCVYAPYLTRLEHLNMAAMWTVGRPTVTKWWELVKAREAYKTGITQMLDSERVKNLGLHGEKAWPAVERMLHTM